MANAKVAPRMYKSRIDLPERTRQEVCELLNESLAMTLDLWSQVKQAHWNVKGSDFYQLHLLFDLIAGEIYEYVDLLAERVTTLGSVAMGTVRMSADKSSLPEYPVAVARGKEHIEALSDRLAQYAKHVRQALDKSNQLNDADTADIYTEISRTADLRLWFLEAHLQADN